MAMPLSIQKSILLAEGHRSPITLLEPVRKAKASSFCHSERSEESRRFNEFRDPSLRSG
jgi:hypothetical protein